MTRVAAIVVLLGVGSSAAAQEMTAFEGRVGDVRHYLVATGGIAVELMREEDVVRSCAYRIESEGLHGITPDPRCDQRTPPRLEGWGDDAPRAFVGEVELSRAPHGHLTIDFGTHRAAWLALAEVAHALSPGRCSPAHRYPFLVDGHTVEGPRYVRVACEPGIELHTEPRRLQIQAGHSGHHRALRCSDFADSVGFDSAVVEYDGALCFRDFFLDQHSTREQIEAHFHGRCRPIEHGDLSCEGFRIDPGRTVTRAED